MSKTCHGCLYHAQSTDGTGNSQDWCNRALAERVPHGLALDADAERCPEYLVTMTGPFPGWSAPVPPGGLAAVVTEADAFEDALAAPLFDGVRAYLDGVVDGRPSVPLNLADVGLLKMALLGERVRWMEKDLLAPSLQTAAVVAGLEDLMARLAAAEEA
jgi:hypothetical protein